MLNVLSWWGKYTDNLPVWICFIEQAFWIPLVLGTVFDWGECMPPQADKSANQVSCATKISKANEFGNLRSFNPLRRIAF